MGIAGKEVGVIRRGEACTMVTLPMPPLARSYSSLTFSSTKNHPYMFEKKKILLNLKKIVGSYLL